MPTGTNSLRLIGMIPRPDPEYRAALLHSIESLKGAMTDRGIDASQISPMPTRMWPVAQDAQGRAYALVSTCNQNCRPSAVPLSRFFPEDPAKPGALPETFVPIESWEATHPPAAGIPSGVPGVTGPIEAAMPKAPDEKSGAPPDDPDAPSSDLPLPPEDPEELEKHPRSERVTQGKEWTEPSEVKKDLVQKPATPTEDQTRELIANVLPGMKARGAVGDMGGALVGIMALQDPQIGRANFQKLMAEKATALQPGSSVYQRLTEALKTFDQIKDQL
jgi:hypothetical protein